MGSKEQIFDHPSHPYTRALLSAAPAFIRKEKAEKKRVLLEGDLPTQFNPPKGCRFAGRSQLKNQALVMVRETIYPFIKEVEELKVAFDDPGIVYVEDNDTAFSLCKQIPAYMCMAQSTEIYRKLNIPVSMVIYSL